MYHCNTASCASSLRVYITMIDVQSALYVIYLVTCEKESFSVVLAVVAQIGLLLSSSQQLIRVSHLQCIISVHAADVYCNRFSTASALCAPRA
jgi:hypothetical protein